MGLVLDSGVPIAAERDAKPVSDLLLELEQKRLRSSSRRLP